jgi:probable 2-oxoglutarate dehydrogenase E1 component DHKTD1
MRQAAASPLNAMGSGTRFEPILEGENNDTQAQNLVFCTGKHFYTLLEALTQAGCTRRTALVRIEEISPFPREQLATVLRKYSGVKRHVWAQEEPMNQGAWTYVRPRLEGLLRSLGKEERITYIGRGEGATTATAVGAWHKREVEEIARAVVEL